MTFLSSFVAFCIVKQVFLNTAKCGLHQAPFQKSMMLLFKDKPAHFKISTQLNNDSWDSVI